MSATRTTTTNPAYDAHFDVCHAALEAARSSLGTDEAAFGCYVEAFTDDHGLPNLLEAIARNEAERAKGMKGPLSEADKSTRAAIIRTVSILSDLARTLDAVA